VPDGGLKSKLDAGTGARVWFEYSSRFDHRSVADIGAFDTQVSVDMQIKLLKPRFIEPVRGNSVSSYPCPSCPVIWKRVFDVSRFNAELMRLR